MTRYIWATYIAAQGGHKDVAKYTEKFQEKKASAVEDLLKDYGKR